MTSDHLETRREAEAALAARRELGVDYEDAVAESLAERVEQLAARRFEQLNPQLPHPAQPSAELDSAEQSARKQGFVLGIVSLGAGIPITAISGAEVDPGLLGIVVSWAGIVAVNVAFGWAYRRRR